MMKVLKGKYYAPRYSTTMCICIICLPIPSLHGLLIHKRNFHNKLKLHQSYQVMKEIILAIILQLYETYKLSELC